MPTLKITEPHRLTKDEAKTRISKLLNDLKIKHSSHITDVEEDWNGTNAIFSFGLMRIKINGQLTVNEGFVELVGTLPLAGLPFRGMAEKAIREEARKLLDA